MNNPEVTITAITKEQLLNSELYLSFSILKLEIIAEEHHWCLTNGLIESAPGSDTEFFTEGANYLIATVDNRVVGFVAFKEWDQCFTMWSLGVTRNMRRNKIGTNLIGRAMELMYETAPKKTVSLQVYNPAPPGVIKFYTSLGFKIPETFWLSKESDTQTAEDAPLISGEISGRM